jgi:hypothetical protein
VVRNWEWYWYMHNVRLLLKDGTNAWTFHIVNKMHIYLFQDVAHYALWFSITWQVSEYYLTGLGDAEEQSHGTPSCSSEGDLKSLYILYRMLLCTILRSDLPCFTSQHKLGGLECCQSTAKYLETLQMNTWAEVCVYRSFWVARPKKV